MVFTSFAFLFLFLPTFLAGYFAVGKPYRNLWLLLWSIVFYGWERPYWVAKDPTLGVIDAINGGSVVYRGLPGRSGSDQFVYQVCNKICVDLCDTATVKIQVKSDNTYQFSVPTGITPNGDGANDELRFEVLEVQPEQYKDNEIVIFNRWGDIVYRAKPYVNNWKGTNTSGQDLPTGTYYYILRLDIPNGVIIKGDITIVK